MTRVFAEKISIRATRRPELENAIALARGLRAVGVAVTLVVHEHKRLGRGLELAALAEQLRADGIALEFLTGELQGSHDPGGIVFTVLAALSGMEREYIRDRALEGHEAARARGKAIGGASVADEPMLSRALHLRDQGMSLREIAARLVITTGAKKGKHPSPATVMRMLRGHDQATAQQISHQAGHEGGAAAPATGGLSEPSAVVLAAPAAAATSKGGKDNVVAPQTVAARQGAGRHGSVPEQGMSGGDHRAGSRSVGLAEAESGEAESGEAGLAGGVAPEPVAKSAGGPLVRRRVAGLEPEWTMTQADPDQEVYTLWWKQSTQVGQVVHQRQATRGYAWEARHARTTDQVAGAIVTAGSKNGAYPSRVKALRALAAEAEHRRRQATIHRDEPIDGLPAGWRLVQSQAEANEGRWRVVAPGGQVAGTLQRTTYGGRRGWQARSGDPDSDRIGTDLPPAPPGARARPPPTTPT